MTRRVGLLALVTAMVLVAGCGNTSEAPSASNGVIKQVAVDDWNWCWGDASGGVSGAPPPSTTYVNWRGATGAYDDGTTRYEGDLHPTKNGNGVALSGTLKNSKGGSIRIVGTIAPCPKSVSDKLAMDHLHHGSSSTLCVVITTTPPAVGASIAGTVTEPDGTSVKLNGTIDRAGTAKLTTEIHQYGMYKFHGTFLDQTLDTSQDVEQTQGTACG